MHFETSCLYTSRLVQNQTIPNTQLGIPQVLVGILSQYFPVAHLWSSQAVVEKVKLPTAM